jgi:hypothetical protein
MDVEALQKMTVAQLREEAKKIPDAKGLSGMKKDELVALIAGQSGGGGAAAAAVSTAKSTAMPTGTPTGKTEIKQRIQVLKQEKKAALAAEDKDRARVCNRQIHRFKHILRKMARTG